MKVRKIAFVMLFIAIFILAVGLALFVTNQLNTAALPVSPGHA